MARSRSSLYPEVETSDRPAEGCPQEEVKTSREEQRTFIPVTRLGTANSRLVDSELCRLTFTRVETCVWIQSRNLHPQAQGERAEPGKGRKEKTEGKVLFSQATQLSGRTISTRYRCNLARIDCHKENTSCLHCSPGIQSRCSYSIHTDCGACNPCVRHGSTETQVRVRTPPAWAHKSHSPFPSLLTETFAYGSANWWSTRSDLSFAAICKSQEALCVDSGDERSPTRPVDLRSRFGLYARP